MKIDDLLYFAPGVRFDQVDLNSPKLPEWFRRRVEGFYVRPAKECAHNGHAFAAGVLLVSCIDALSRLRFGPGVGERFVRFVREELKSFAYGNHAERFYQDFRNGLVHEARIKEGGQFSLEVGTTVQESDGLILVNPDMLAGELESALESYINLLQTDPKEVRKLVESLKRDLAKDFQFAERI